jgi:hypothetical protein
MIGNAWPLAGTGYLIAEEGDIDPVTLQLRIRGYQLLDKYGNTVAEGFPDEAAARRYVDALPQKKLTEGRENVK